MDWITSPETWIALLTLTALEIVLGTRARLFNNVYGGISIRLGYLITETAEGDFPNLWIPGFNKVTDGSNFGIGYNYSISYLIPFFKKTKKSKVAPAERPATDE